MKSFRLDNSNLSIFILVAMFVLILSFAIFQAKDKIESIEKDRDFWKQAAVDGSRAYLESHKGIVPKGTLVWPNPPGSNSFIVIGFKPSMINVSGHH